MFYKDYIHGNNRPTYNTFVHVLTRINANQMIIKLSLFLK